MSAVTPRYHGQSSGMRPNVPIVEDLHSPGWSPPTSLPIPVFHERHGPMFPSPGFSPPYQPYMPHPARHEYRRYPNPAYVPGAPLVPWPPRSEPHHHQPNPYAFSGPRQIAFQSPPEDAPPQYHQTSRSNLNRSPTPVSFIPNDSKPDSTWPDLLEANKTPTKASVQRTRAATTQVERPVHKLPGPVYRNDSIIRKEAVAKLIASRSGSERSDSPESESWRPGLPFRPTSTLKLAAQMTLMPSPMEKPSDDDRRVDAVSLGSPISRTNSVSFGIEGCSLASIKSFGDGVWGNDDLPMLKARLKSVDVVTQESLLQKNDRLRQATAPADLGFSDDLPYTPLMDNPNLFRSPSVEFDTPGSDVLLTPYQNTDKTNKHRNTLDIDVEAGEDWQGRPNQSRSTLQIDLNHEEDWKDVAREEIRASIRQTILSELDALEEIGNADGDEETKGQRETTKSTETRPVIRVLNRLLRTFEGTDVEHETSESESSTLSSPTSSSDRTSQRHPDPTSSPTPEHLNPTCNMPIMTEEHHESTAQEKQDLVHSTTTFASILLDGDSTLFHPDLIRRGAKGGQEAAYALSTRVYHLCLDRATSVPNCFTVQIFFNEQAIGTRLIETGVIKSRKTLSEFVTGFTDSHGLFTFIMVSTRQQAAAKIKEHLRLYANLKVCSLILLASNQAKEYEDLLVDFNAVGQGAKIHIARSAPIGSLDPLENVMGARLETIPGLFKISIPRDAAGETDEIAQSEAPDDDESEASDVGSLDFTRAPSGLIGEQTLPMVPASLASEDQDDFVPVLSRKSKKLPLGNAGRFSFTQSAMSAKFAKTVSISDKKRKKLRGPSSGFQPSLRLEYDHEDYLSVKRYNPRPCHRFYLTSGCKNGAKCHYGHDYDLTKGEINALKSLSKEMLCPAYAIGTCKGTSETCIYGHECPRSSECTFGSECWFTPVQGLHGKKARN